MLLNDIEIAARAKDGMIAPFLHSLIRTVNPDEHGMEGAVKAISYGQSSFGYDVRLAPRAKIYWAAGGRLIDPKRPHKDDIVDAVLHTDDASGEQYFIIPPHGYLLGHTVEWFNLPRDITAIVLGKSTYARSLIMCNTTPIEAGFSGEVVIELANPTNHSVKVYANEGIGQFLFLTGNPCWVSYADRDGKYQNQRGITLSKV